MTDGLAAVQARISQLRALVDPASTRRTGSSGSAGSTSATQFDGALADALSAQGLTASGDLGEQAVSVAKRYLGVPYRWGGTNPATGLDCSGLTKLVFGQLGIDLPRVSRDQAKVGTEVASLKDARPGDLVFFDEPVDHVGIYVGDGKMLDAPKTGDKVRIRDVWETPSHIRRVLPDVAAAGGVAGTAAASGLSATAASGALDSPYASLFTAAGRRYGVDPALLSAIARAESSYDAGAVSRAGARGLMQLMPGTARDLGVNPLDPAQAVDGAARLMSRHLQSFGGRVDLALAAYNAGPGNVRRYGGVPPFDETQNYVRRVTRYWGELR